MEIVPGFHWVDRIWDTKVYLLLDGRRATVIDAAMPGREQAVWQHLASLGYAPEAVSQIWLTHGDIDHMGSTAALQARAGAQVVSHHADVDLVEGRVPRQLGPGPLAPAYSRVFNWAMHHLLAYQPPTVDLPVQDGDWLGEWQVVHLPGHTQGSVGYYHPERKLAVVGDAINHRRGRLGAPPPLFTPNMAQARMSIHRLAALDFDVCCFGHGLPLTQDARQRVQAFADSL